MPSPWLLPGPLLAITAIWGIDLENGKSFSFSFSFCNSSFHINKSLKHSSPKTMVLIYFLGTGFLSSGLRASLGTPQTLHATLSQTQGSWLLLRWSAWDHSMAAQNCPWGFCSGTSAESLSCPFLSQVTDRASGLPLSNKPQVKIQPVGNGLEGHLGPVESFVCTQ